MRLKTTSNLVEEENLNPKEKREIYEKGWRNLECSTSEKAFDQDDDSPEAQDDLFFQHIPHPKSEQGIQGQCFFLFHRSIDYYFKMIFTWRSAFKPSFRL